MQLAADINDIETKQPATIRFYFPRPIVTAAQPFVELNERTPEPAIADYQNTIVHQLQASKGSSPAKQRFSQNFVVSVYEVKSTVQLKYVKSYSDMNKALYAASTRADKFIPSDDRAVTNLASSIVGKETNPYIKAKLIYTYMLDNYKLRDTAAKPESPLNLIKNKRGDAYCFALLYTALLRAAGIPALTDGGILVDRNIRTRNHWWCEFYLYGIGWIPVDPALGGGSLMDLGIYPVSLAIHLFGEPDRVTATGELLSSGVDVRGTVILSYDSGEHAGMEVVCLHSKTSPGTESTFASDRDVVAIDDCQWPKRIELRGPTANGDATQGAQGREDLSVERKEQEPGHQLAYEVAEVCRLVRTGAHESELHPLSSSVTAIAALEEARRQVGVRFPADS